MRIAISFYIALVFCACSSGPKRPARQDSVPPLVGYYESADSFRVMSVMLRSGGDVDILTDSLNSKPETMQIGNWQLPDSTSVMMTMLTVGSDNFVRDTLHFQLQDSSLLMPGLRLAKKQRPVPVEKMLLIWVKNESQCDRGPGFGKTPCYDVQYGEKPAGPWQRFSEPIDSFTFEKGFIYKLKVRRIPRDSLSRQPGSYKYKLAEVLEKAHS